MAFDRSLSSFQQETLRLPFFARLLYLSALRALCGKGLALSFASVPAASPCRLFFAAVSLVNLRVLRGKVLF
jgi:hypothetical protein